MRYNEITELFNSEASNVKWTSDSLGDLATFTLGDKIVTVSFKRLQIEGYVPVVFSVNGRYEVTGGGDQFKIFSQVGKLIIQYMKDNQVSGFRFDANSLERSRVALYTSLSKRLEKAMPYNLNIEQNVLFTYFKFKKKGKQVNELNISDSNKEQDDLNELLDGSTTWKWIEQNQQQWIADFNSGNEDYKVRFFYDKFDDLWTVSFGNIVQYGSGDLTRLNFDIINNAEVFEVFATVKEIVYDFMQTVKPAKFIFTAEGYEPSRIKLYNRMSKQLASHFDYTVNVIKGDAITYELYKKEEQLTELFDRKSDITWISQTNKLWLAEFPIDDMIYEVRFAKGYSIWSFSFSLSGDDGQKFNINNKGNAILVFSTVLAAMAEFVNQVKPDRFSFTADIGEPSRIKLYDRLSKQITTKIPYDLEINEQGIYKDYLFSKQ